MNALTPAVVFVLHDTSFSFKKHPKQLKHAFILFLLPPAKCVAFEDKNPNEKDVLLSCSDLQTSIASLPIVRPGVLCEILDEKGNFCVHRLERFFQPIAVVLV